MKPCKIIIAEQHDLFREGVKYYLECNLPCVEVTAVSNTESLIEAVLKNSFNLVISGIDMKGRNGLFGLEQTKAIAADLPVMILSSYGEDVYGVRAIRSGASAYLCKTATSEEILAAVKMLLCGKKYITENLREMLVHSDSMEPFARLSNQEVEVLRLTALGNSSTEICERLSLAYSSIYSIRSKIVKALGMESINEFTQMAITKKLIRDI